jgi:hypothetical protein
MKYALSLILTIILTTCASAQRRPIGLVGINYSTGFTTQDTRNFIKEFSWRGLGLGSLMHFHYW